MRKEKMNRMKWMCAAAAGMLLMGGTAVQAENSAKQNPTASERAGIYELLEELGLDAEIVDFGLDGDEETAEALMELLGYPAVYYPEGSNYHDVVAAYWETRVRGKEEGFTPIIVVADDNLLDMVEWNLEENAEDIQEALETTVDTFMIKEALEETAGSLLEDRDADDTMKNISPDGCKAYLEESDLEVYINNTFSSILSYDGESTTDLLLMEVPTENPWELSAYVPFSGFNECPDPTYLTFICKYWYDKFGAEPVVFYGDGMELYVQEPLTPEEALNAAISHIGAECEWIDTAIWLAPELEERYDTMTVEELVYAYAECLQNSPVWYFWWD